MPKHDPLERAVWLMELNGSDPNPSEAAIEEARTLALLSIAESLQGIHLSYFPQVVIRPQEDDRPTQADLDAAEARRAAG